MVAVLNNSMLSIAIMATKTVAGLEIVDKKK
jgi:hypothetical protein